MREGKYNKSENIPLFTIEENDDIDYNHKYEVDYTENDSLFSLKILYLRSTFSVAASMTNCALA